MKNQKNLKPHISILDPDSLPTYYPMLCAWCEAEGVRTITGYGTIEHSSGICARHNREMHHEITKVRKHEHEPRARARRYPGERDAAEQAQTQAV